MTFAGTGAFVMAALFIASAAWAQQRFPLKTSSPGSETTYTQQHVVEVGDGPNHQVRIYEIRRRNTTDPMTLRGVKVTESWARGISDYADYSGPTYGYIVYQLENGDRVLARYAGTVQSLHRADGTREYIYHGNTTITGGTGEFQKIRGYLRDFSKGTSKAGKALSNEVSGEGEYWFEE